MVLRAVILDLGNVLVFHDDDRNIQAFSQLFEVPVERVQTSLEEGFRTAVHCGKFPGNQLREEINRRLGRQVSEDALLAAWNCHFSLNTPMIELVEKLVGRVRLVLLSNTNEQHMAFLRPQLPVLEKFDGLVLSHIYGVMKPDRAIYESALALAAVAPHEAVYFDDVERYVRAASDLGIHARVFTSAADFAIQLATLGIEL